MLASILLLVALLDTPHIQVIDLDGGEPRHLIVVIDGEPYKVISIPAGSGPVPPPIPGPSPGPVPPPTPPTPAPLEGALWVTYIVPDAPSVADVGPTTHAPLRGRIDNKAVNWRMQHTSDAEITRRHFEEHAKNAPVTVFQDQTGKVLRTVKGNDPQAILDAIKVYKGGN
jgi:hypothetical protein